MLTKYLILLLLAFPDFIISQSSLHDLQGTWKMEGKDQYEHWDLLTPGKMQGIGYSNRSGIFQVSEYLFLTFDNIAPIYIATVPGQNAGKSISFRGKKLDNTWIFTNKSHDFPQAIEYTFSGRDQIKICLRGADSKEIKYSLNRVQSYQLNIQNENSDYDSLLASKLHADDYGMKKYYFVILKTGALQSQDTAVINAAFRGHMSNITELVKDGKLIVAGPLFKNEKNYRGLFILDKMENEETVKKVLASDTAIKAGLLDYEIYSWYGSAALPEYLPFHEKIWRIKH